MANTYKNIIITPNRSSDTADPNISFRGANTGSNTEITLRVYPVSNGTLSFEGSAGQLFSITNDLSGSIFSVNDVSGIPSIEVFANGVIRLAQYSGNVFIGNSMQLVVNAGNVGIGTTAPTSNLHVVGNANITTGINTTTVNATTVNVATLLTTTGINVSAAALNAYGQANTATTNAGNAYNTANNRVSSVSGTSGRITSSGGLTPTIDLATAGAGAASYSSGISAITVDAYGRVTSVSGSASYVPTNGTGASGTWGISITGNSGTVGSLSVHSGTNNEANKLVRTDGNGYIYTGWINTISGDSGVANRLTRIYSSYDGFLRFSTLTDFKVHIGESAKNSYSRRIDYTTDSNYWVGSFGHSGYGANETFHGGSGFFDIWGGTNYPSGTSHIHGFNALHYTTNSLGSTGGNAYGIQVAGQYNLGGELWSRACNGGTFSSWRLQLDSSNYSSYAMPVGSSATNSVDIRAPIFYDNNNTAYYVDPASTSRLYNVEYFNGGQALFYTVTNNSLRGYIQATDTDDAHLIISTSGGEDISFRDGGLAGSVNMVIRGNATVEAYNDFRAPIFYDNNDTNYYTDPNSSSRLLHIFAGNVSSSNDGGWNARINLVGSSHARLDVVSNSDGIITTMFSHTGQGVGKIGTYSNHPLTLMAQGANDGGYVYNGSIRSPLFYDSNNTAYYTDPASTSSLNALTMAGGLVMNGGGIGSNAYSAGVGSNEVVRVYAPQGAAASWDGAITGAIKIRLPVRANNGMWRMTIKIYNYGTNQISEYTVGNYSYDNGAYNSAAGFVGTNGAPVYNVRLGNDGTYDCVWIGETNAGWSYPVVAVTDFICGFRNGNAATWNNNWNISYVTSFGTVGTTMFPSTRGGTVHGTEFYGTAFYDSNNTGYYVDPASTTNLNTLILSGTSYFRPSNWIQFDSSYGLYWPNTNGAHLEGNTLSSYGSIAIRGSRNSWRGIHFYDGGNTPHLMFDGSANGGIYYESGSRWAMYYNYGNNSWGFGSSTTSSSYYLYVSGAIYSTGNIVAYSDARKKENIMTVDNALEKIDNLRGVYYNRIDDETKTRQIGVIAQEINEILPEVVTYASDVDEYGVSYGNLAGLFIEAIKEQTMLINNLRDEIELLKKILQNK